MLQIALGGHSLTTDGLTTSNFVDAVDNVYLEPGFNIMFPADFSAPLADTVYMLIRKRSNLAETSFESLDPDDFFVNVKDATTGEDLDVELVNNSGDDLVFSGWNTSAYEPIVLTISPFSEDDDDRQVRVIDIQVIEASSNDFIEGRLTLDAASNPFAYLVVENRRSFDRRLAPNYGNIGLMFGSALGSYALLSPLATFEESPRSVADFSYPPDQVFYRFEKTLNDERYDFEINSVSHALLSENLKIAPVPKFSRVGVLTVDGYLANALEGAEGLTYVDIKATGRISGQEDTFRMFFSRSNNIAVI